MRKPTLRTPWLSICDDYVTKTGSGSASPGEPVAWSASGDVALVTQPSFDGQARLWDWLAGTLACPPLKHDEEVFSGAMTPDGRFALTGAGIGRANSTSGD